jgi:choline dehydrogenase
MRVLFDQQRAVGVEYQQNGQAEQARAEREVILSGGAINSPQLLMLSGVGAADYLKTLGIAVVMDLPGVGQNLQDHLATGVTYVCTQPITLANAERLNNILNYLLFQKGPLSSNVAEAGGFVKTRSDARVPDLQFHFAPVYFVEHGFVKPEGHGFTIGPTLLYPKSRGQIG